MELNSEIYATLAAIEWFDHCGRGCPRDLPFLCQAAPNVAEAVASGRFAEWQDARTEAQGDLTSYLAKYDPHAYFSWNTLAKASGARILLEIQPKVTEALTRLGINRLSDGVLLDLNRIALQSAYAKQLKRVPDFYYRLLMVYRRGHLPCGWHGSLDAWPEGWLVVY